MPSSGITTLAGSTLSPSVAVCPSTVTRPAAMSSSQARREPTPAAARTFCRRSSVVGIGDLVRVVGQERRERRQFLDAVQAELLQEQGRGAVQERAALRLAAALLDKAAGCQRADDAVAVHPPDRRNAGAGHRLL